MDIFRLLLVSLSAAPSGAELLALHSWALLVDAAVNCPLWLIHHCAELFVFWLLACGNSLHIPDTNLLSVVHFANTSQ